MARLYVNKEVLSKAKALVAEKKRPEPTVDQPLPVVSLWYPIHGKGPGSTERFVRVLEMNDTLLKGFEITSEFDEEPGKPHTYRLDKITWDVKLLHLAKLPKK